MQEEAQRKMREAGSYPCCHSLGCRVWGFVCPPENFADGCSEMVLLFFSNGGKI